MVLQILLIRHGETEWNRTHRIMGRLPVPLNPHGRRQAAEVARALKKLKIDQCYSSPLKRARETMAFLKKGRRCPLEFDKSLEEIDYGDWVGKTFDEVKHELAYKLYHTRPTKSRVPGGESLLGVQKRAVRCIEKIRKKWKSGTIAVVSHADVIKVIVAHYLRLHLNEFQRIRIDNGSVSILSFTERDVTKSASPGGERVVTLNSPPALVQMPLLFGIRKTYG